MSENGERFTGHGHEWKDSGLNAQEAKIATSWVEQKIDKRAMLTNKDRVEDVRDAHAMPLADLADRLEDVRQRRPRDDGVLHDEIGVDASHGAECLLAALPEAGALRLVRCGAETLRAGIAEDRFDRRRFVCSERFTTTSELIAIPQQHGPTSHADQSIAGSETTARCWNWSYASSASAAYIKEGPPPM